MVSVGLTTLASSSYDLSEAVLGKRSLKVLCIGHGGGSLPLFLASKISGATVHVVDIDPVVISASIQAMGFPSSTVKGKSGCSFTRPPDIDKLLWEGIHDRLFLYRCDAEDFIIENRNVYDLVFIDAYDGDDIFPYKLWDSDSLFLKHLKHRIHPLHGTVVVNLHSDSDLLTIDTRNNSPFESILPMGKYVSRICRAYKHQFGLAFAVSVPWLCNVTLVACRSELFGSGLQGPLANRNLVLSTLISKSYLVDSAICLPFPCLESHITHQPVTSIAHSHISTLYFTLYNENDLITSVKHNPLHMLLIVCRHLQSDSRGQRRPVRLLEPHDLYCCDPWTYRGNSVRGTGKTLTVRRSVGVLESDQKGGSRGVTPYELRFGPIFQPPDQNAPRIQKPPAYSLTYVYPAIRSWRALNAAPCALRNLALFGTRTTSAPLFAGPAVWCSALGL
uniref:Methyltransferase-like protein 13 n=1 Tax=Ananas comosus var. bracteatus TaxID=296719 RepID=A0A6V7QMT4_ANACO|nr:unnamed protein product [Ananas comosus var. bracteatus]